MGLDESTTFGDGMQKIHAPMGSAYVDLQSPAGLGIAALVYNYDGSVYASDESRMLAEMGDHSFRLGHLDVDSYEIAPAPVAPRPIPAAVSLIAFPGGRIFVDGVFRGADSTGTITLTAGDHEVRIVNRFLGEHTTTVSLASGQTGALTIEW